MKQFDDIFREKVEKTFSNYDAGNLADEGWKSFSEGRRFAKRSAFIIPLWARAASVALIVGAAAFMTYLALQRQIAEDPTALAGAETIIRQSSDATVDTIEPDYRKTKTDLEALSVEPLISSITTQGTARVKIAEAITEREVIVQEDTHLAMYGESLPKPVTQERIVTVIDDSLNVAIEQALRGLLEKAAEETVTEEQTKQQPRTALMAGFSGLLAGSEEYASTSPGVTVGLYLEQKISERISVRPGLALSVNSLGFHDGRGSDKALYSLPLSDGNTGMSSSYTGELSMIAMEVPVNLVFKIIDRGRSNLYLSTGASTMIYLSQQFEGSFVNEYTRQEMNTVTGEISQVSRYSTVAVNNEYGAFSRADYFGLANISAGYSMPYGQTGSLLIEPFLQLPLSDLTSMNLRVRYGGLSMKVRFGGLNKK